MHVPWHGACAAAEAESTEPRRSFLGIDEHLECGRHRPELRRSSLVVEQVEAAVSGARFITAKRHDRRFLRPTIAALS